MTIKIKHNGQTLRARILQHTDTITDKCLYTNTNRAGHIDLSSKGIIWIPTKAAGEKVSEHPDRTYVEILSKFY